MNPYLSFVQGIQSGMANAASLPAPTGTRAPAASGPTVLLFSPHPDDECITGLLPLRLARELDWRVVNVPVTFGSDAARQAARHDELATACAYLGWRLQRARDDFNALSVGDVIQTLRDFRPDAIVVPHDDDWNARHVATHHLVMDALGRMDAAFRCAVVETEFWKPMHAPNLMVEGDAEQVAELIAATALHTGEVRRNPYHLTLPAWMQDNSRRGGEVVCGQGATPPDFTFTTLYRLGEWRQGRLEQPLKTGAAIAVGANQLREFF